MRSALAALVTAGLLLALVPAAEGYRYTRERRLWADTTLTYHVAPALRWHASTAARAYDRARAGFRLKRVSRARGAHILIRTQRTSCVGNPGFALPLQRARVFVSPACDRYVGSVILAHELGHVLGLDHEDRRCALMNSHMRDHAPVRCSQPPPGSTAWWRSPLRSDDLRGLRRLWSRPASQPPAADFSTGLTGEVHRAGEEVRFIDTSRDDQGVVSMRWDFGDPASGAANTAKTRGVAHHTYAAPGTYTVTLRVVDFHGQTDTARKTVVIEAPAPEPEPEPE